ncbi:MAG: Trk system potassium transporter TrkA [Candidatus Anammoxibacter sp.]
MKILIVGAGAVGFNLAKQLSNEGHDVSVVEQDAKLVRKIDGKLDAFVVVGGGSSPSVLESCGIQETDMVLAVTTSDEVNIVVCMLANQYGVKKKIARIRNYEFTSKSFFLKENDFCIDHMINPDLITVNSILKIIETPGSTYVADFEDINVVLRGFNIRSDAPIVGKQLSELKEIESTDSFLIVAIQRGGEMIIPGDETVIQTNDNVFFVVAEAGLPYLLPMVTKRSEKVAKVLIYGATNTGLLISKKLENSSIEVTLVEPKQELAEKAASDLAKTVVLHGHATDIDLLKEASIETMDFFIAASNDDQSNLLAAMLAKKFGAKKTIVITDEHNYVTIFSSLGMDVVMNPRQIMVSAILQHARRGHVPAVVKINESDAEAIEFIVEEGAKIDGKQLSTVKFPQGAILGAIIQDGVMDVPTGKSVINSGDRVIVFSLPTAIEKVQSLFCK